MLGMPAGCPGAASSTGGIPIALSNQLLCPVHANLPPDAQSQTRDTSIRSIRRVPPLNMACSASDTLLIPRQYAIVLLVPVGTTASGGMQKDGTAGPGPGPAPGGPLPTVWRPGPICACHCACCLTARQARPLMTSDVVPSPPHTMTACAPHSSTMPLAHASKACPGLCVTTTSTLAPASLSLCISCRASRRLFRLPWFAHLLMNTTHTRGWRVSS